MQNCKNKRKPNRKRQNSRAHAKTNPSENPACEKDGERSNTLSSLRFWTQPAGPNVGCDESDIFFFFLKKNKKKKTTQKERSNSCSSRANAARPKAAGGQRLMHSSDSSLRGTTMTPRHQKSTSWGRRSGTRKDRRGVPCSSFFNFFFFIRNSSKHRT